MHYKEHTNGLIEIYCWPSQIPSAMRLLSLRAKQMEEKTREVAREVEKINLLETKESNLNI